MIIVLFHVLYLFGKFVYQKYQVKKEYSVNDDVIESKKELKISDGVYGEIYPEASEEYQEKPLSFFPPAYKQRYVAVSDILNNTQYEGKIRKVVDFGCSEMGFLVYLKQLPSIEEILCVDIDRTVLESFKEKGAPLVSEYLHTRTTPLKIEICRGSVTENDKKLEKTDAVICIELIEHLYPDTLTNLPYNIFGFIKPKLAIFTTPNADFNVLFPNFFGFRHHDHKFEWTRQQFQDWAHNIILRYPDYVVTFDGICKGPEGTEHLGTCTQMAIFHRLSDKESFNEGVEGLYETIAVHEYPFRVDNRSDEEKIIDEVTYYIRHLSYQDSDMEEEVPLTKLLNILKSFHISIDALKTILEEAGWSIADREIGPVVLIPPQSTFSDYSAVEDYFWPGNSATDEDDDDDDWNGEAGPPVNSARFWDVEFCEESWDDEPSVIIPRNNSLSRDNTYLYGGENALLDTVSEVVTDFENSEKCIETNSTENLSTKPSLPSNVCSTNLNHSNDSFEHNSLSELNESIAFSDSSFRRRLEDIKEDSSLDLLHSSSAQNQSIGLHRAQNFNRTLDSPAYMSVSRESTSPDPYLLQTIKMDQVLGNNSMCNETISESWTLDTSYKEANTFRDDGKERKKTPKNSLSEDSLRSIYLNASYNENEDSDFETVHSSTGEKTRYYTISQGQNVQREVDASSEDSQFKLNSSISLTCSSAISDNRPQFTSSPKVEVKNRSLNRNKDSSGSSNTMQQFQLSRLSSNNSVDDSSVVPLPSNSEISISAAATVSYDTLKKWCDENEYPANIKDKLKSRCTDDSPDNTLTDSNASTVTYSLNDNKDTIENLSVTGCLNDDEDGKRNDVASVNASNTQSINCDTQTEMKSTGSKDVRTTGTPRNHAKDFSSLDCISASVLKNEERAECVARDQEMKCKNVNSGTLERVENAEAKPSSPEAEETPPNSCSPEIMDSGYPNSASAQDITPEYDLSSIAQDHISDSEPPSIAEAPRLAVLEVVEVENGDLANNNRDGEGNNMMAVELNDLDDLQPLIDVLENDLENENDIYVLENDFPVWLLGILNMANPIDVEMQIRDHGDLRFPRAVAGGGEARYLNMDRDEGFDSSSEDSEVENNEMEDDSSDLNENAAMDSVENENASNSDSGSDQWAVGYT